MNNNANLDSHTNWTVDPLSYPSITCDECGNQYYKQVVVFKRIPGVVTGNGAEPTILPIPVYVCDKCGKLMEEYRKDFEGKEDTPSDNAPKSSIIL